jgi:NAD(P)-dependent dehydrogenase (short-subunit alcohol dehydrogenase family)
MRLDGRFAIVTGGARGIGLAVARRFVDAGAMVAIWDRDSDPQVRVNCVAPALTRTRILDMLPQPVIDYALQRMPIGRVALPEEIAAVVHFLSSDDASFVTGQCYDVSGGRSTY